MLSVKRFIALLLLALWWPATMHCEIASVIGADDTSCHAASGDTNPSGDHHDHPSADNCDSVENGDYRAEQSTLQIAPTAAVVWTCILALATNDSAADANAAGEFISGACEPAWLPTWHFERRAAPSPRAPSVTQA